MSNRTTPLSISVQPGTHLSIDSRPGTAENSQHGSGLSHSAVDFSHLNSSHLVKASIYVTSPFKQGPQKTYQDSRMFYDVSSPIKQEIIQSLSICKQINSEEDAETLPSSKRNKTFHARKSQGRLLPLLGAPAVKGPAMQECIGVFSGSRKVHGRSQNHHKNCFGKQMFKPKKLNHTVHVPHNSFTL